MIRSLDSQPDSRVNFEPDAWQIDVLNKIDADESMLIVAPTSSGKTFISFAAMEKVLRESDDGIVIYIAPTKALVNQVAAEVFARFRKDVPGRQVSGSFFFPAKKEGKRRRSFLSLSLSLSFFRSRTRLLSIASDSI